MQAFQLNLTQQSNNSFLFCQASASWDCSVRVWDSPSGQLLHVLEGHTGWVQACSFSADGKLLASASDDQTVRVWNTETGKCIRELEVRSRLS
ncbi:PREDICTED: nuclear distribution protein PAC1-like [Acropora digitifera]|uniref:nuclear distribution protein PAC1-like n=1 Tax=Acropora digitifera TaxID=70779 RepID=UPI00077AD305|nr:PREDICTED: nuclear distribution protein PAC1-like [Acropora digitifera]